MLRVLPTFVLILGCVWVVPTNAQRGACPNQTIPVSISTKDGEPVPPLTGADFEAVYRKKVVRIISATVNREPSRVVLLFDASDSMRDVRSEDEWNFAVDLGETLVAEMSRTSEIGLEVFATKPVRIANPTNEPMNLKTELEALRAHPKALLPAPSRTALWDAVLDSLKMFDRPHLGDAIYVITDGGDNASGASLKQAAQTLKEAGVRLFAFVFVKRSGSTSPEEVLGPSDVLQVVDETGGTAVFNQFDSRGIFLLPKDPAIFDKLGKPSQLGLLLGSQYWRIFNFYRVSIDLPTIVDKRQQLKLGLVGLTKPQQDNIVLKYPHMLVPCQ